MISLTYPCLFYCDVNCDDCIMYMSKCRCKFWSTL